MIRRKNINEMIAEFTDTIKGIGKDAKFRRIRNERIMGIEMYQGDQLEYLKPKYANIKDVTLVVDNITRRVVQEWSMVYKSPPGYSSEKLLETFPHRIDTMKSVERYSNLLGIVGVRPVIEDGKGYHDIILDFMTFFDVDTQNPDPIGLIYPKSGINFYLWTDDEFLEFDLEGKIKDRGPNEYGKIPVVFKFVEFGEWDHTGMNDVVRSNQVYNEGLTNLHHTHYFQSFKIPYITSESSLNNFTLELDVSKPIVLENAVGVNIGMLDLQSNFTQSIEVMKFTLDRTLSNYHMRSEFEDGGNVSSGLSIIARKSGLMEAREAMIPGWDAFESDLYDMERLVCEKNNINLDKVNEVTFTLDPIVKDPQETRDHWDWLINNGYKRPIDYMIEEMGLSEEEAQKRIEDAGGEFITALRSPAEPV